MADQKYVSVADTAKLVRQALKESFPGIKFSVRSSSYAGGASIRVGWTDGPTGAQVDKIGNAFKGAYFDGQLDYQGTRDHILDGQLVHFCADYITTDREHSPDLIKRAWAKVCRDHGTEASEQGKLGEYPHGGFGLIQGQYIQPSNAGYDLGSLLHQELSRRTCYAEPKRSATLARVSFYGDDGYGAGTVGTPGKRGTMGGYPDHERRAAAASTAAKGV